MSRLTLIISRNEAHHLSKTSPTHHEEIDQNP
jgi:hypothetical protein